MRNVVAWEAAVQHTLEASGAVPAPPANYPANPAPEAEQQYELSPLSPGDALSPSQAATFLNCPAAWMFRYLLRIPDPQTAARFVGTCFHKTMEAYFRFMVANAGARPSDTAIFLDGSFELIWADGVDAVEFMDAENIDELRKECRALLEVFIREEAQTIFPTALELPVSGDIAKVPIRGRIDILDAMGRVVDMKTGAKAPVGIRPGYRLQVTAYVMLSASATGEARLFTITKTKTIKVIQQTFTVGDADKKYARAMFPMIQDAIRDGLFYPRRDSYLCSRKWCGYWRACVKEFGGEVE